MDQKEDATTKNLNSKSNCRNAILKTRTQNKATFSSDVLSITLETRDKDQSWIEQLRSALCESFTGDNRRFLSLTVVSVI